MREIVWFPQSLFVTQATKGGIVVVVVVEGIVEVVVDVVVSVVIGASVEVVVVLFVTAGAGAGGGERYIPIAAENVTIKRMNIARILLSLHPSIDIPMTRNGRR